MDVAFVRGSITQSQMALHRPSYVNTILTQSRGVPRLSLVVLVIWTVHVCGHFLRVAARQDTLGAVGVVSGGIMPPLARPRVVKIKIRTRKTACKSNGHFFKAACQLAQVKATSPRLLVVDACQRLKAAQWPLVQI